MKSTMNGSETWRPAQAVPIERLQNTRRLMNDALPTAMVSGYENHVPEVSLPDPDDRHVVAAGIAAGGWRP
jgi:hypothetical protein